MDEYLRPWVVSTDPETIDLLLRRWHTQGLHERIEDYAHDLGCYPDQSLGQRDSIFVLTTPDRRRYPVWEPGPNPRPVQSPAD